MLDGWPLALTDTLPVSPPKKAMVNESVGLVPTGRLTVVADAVIVNVGAETTVRLKVALAVMPPPDPLTVIG